MKLQDLVQHSPRTIDADETIGTAARTLVWHGLRHMPVLRDGKLVGIVSERELAGFQARHGTDASGTPVSEVMRSAPPTVGPGDTLADAATRMAEEGVDCLPIDEHGAFIGLVTTTDVLGLQIRDTLGSESAESRGPTVADVMTPDPVIVHPDDSLLDAAGRMTSKNIRHLPVVDGAGKVIGMLSDRDLRGAIGYVLHGPEDISPYSEIERLEVKNVMTRPVLTTRAQRPLRALGAELAGMQIGALPVVDERGRVVGIVSIVDVLRGLSSE